MRHPGQGPQSGTRAGIQKGYDYIELLLDSGSRPPAADSSGMTGSANCDMVLHGERRFSRSQVHRRFEISILCGSLDIGFWNLFVIWCLGFGLLGSDTLLLSKKAFGVELKDIPV